MRTFFLLILFSSCVPLFGQDQISNLKYFENFFRSQEEKSLLVVGENHASSVGSTIYPDLIKYLNKKVDLNTLLIEFGPSEAYFYSKYLETGDEKHLNYTIYAGSYKGWRETWREIYQYNKSLDVPLNIVGIDFDRTRTMAYALFSIFSDYEDCPAFIQVLMNEIKTDEFYKTYTISYPTDIDKEWTAKTKSLLKSKYWELSLFLNPKDLKIVTGILENTGVGYGGEREKALAKSTERYISQSEEQNFLLLIGRSHAYLNKIYDEEETLTSILMESNKIKLLTGVILFHNSVLLGGKDSKERIKLQEIKNKIPWKRYYEEFTSRSKKDLTIIPLDKELCPLTYYTDYILLARNQEPYEILN